MTRDIEAAQARAGRRWRAALLIALGAVVGGAISDWRHRSGVAEDLASALRCARPGPSRPAFGPIDPRTGRHRDFDGDYDGIRDGDDQCRLLPGPAQTGGCPVFVL